MIHQRVDKLSLALADVDDSYLEEALTFARKRQGLRLFPKLSAACVAAALLLAVSATAFAAVSMSLSWRDIFRQDQTVIGDEDEAPVASGQTADIDTLQIDVVKAISDERMLYLLYSVRANDGATLDPNGRFASFDMAFPGKKMSGAYQQYFLARKEGVPENELDGAICADWQAGKTAQKLVLTFTDWQEKERFADEKVDFDVAKMVAEAGGNAHLPALFTGNFPQYLWQPGKGKIQLPYGNVSICNAGWEEGTLQLVMKGPTDAGEWAAGQNWYFVDTRTGVAVYPEPRAYYHTPDDLGEPPQDADWCYFWNFVSVDKASLPYLEMHWGGVVSYGTVLPGEWQVEIHETPVSIQSNRLAENVPLSHSGEELLANKIECSKLSLAIYFDEYVDSTTGILGACSVFDTDGNPIDCNWGFTANQNDGGCMIWARFREPIDPETIGKLMFCGETIFAQ